MGRVLSIVTLNEVKGLGRSGANARPQIHRRCGWLSMTFLEVGINAPSASNKQ
jgi:hypothetical protein